MAANGDYLSYGRWDEYRRATDSRLVALEGMAINERLSRIEERGQAEIRSSRQRRDRTWIIVLGILTGIVFPLIVTAVITLLHLQGLYRHGRLCVCWH